MISPHGPIEATELADESVTEAKLADDSVTEAKLAADAVTTDKIDDDTITNDKVKSDAAIDASKINPDLTNGVIGVASGYKIARGQIITTDETDTVVTGLDTVVAAVACLEDDPTLANTAWVTCVIGDQAGSPAAGSIIIKGWIPTSDSNPTPKAAATFGKKVNWIAIGV